jgi:hypothetical protein
MTDTALLDPDALQDELQRAKQRFTELRRQKKLADIAAARHRRSEAGIPEKSHVKNHPPVDASESEYVYGARAIARVTGMAPSSVYYWHRNGMFGDAVWAAGPKTLVGSVSKLRNLGPR